MSSFTASCPVIHPRRVGNPAHQPERLRNFRPIVDAPKRLRAQSANGRSRRAMLDSVNREHGSCLADAAHAIQNLHG